MNEISQMIVNTTEKILQDFCGKEVVNEAENGVWPTALWGTLEQTGMTMIGVPENAAGSGGNVADALRVVQVAAEYSIPLPLAETMLVNWLLADAGLPIEEGPATLAFVYPSDCIQFTKQADGWTLTGKAHDVPWARYAKKMVVVSSEQGGLVAIVNAGQCQIQAGKNMAGEPRDHVWMEELFVEGKDVSVTANFSSDKLLHTGALIRAAQMTGALNKILKQTIAYSQERTQFGRPISRFQAVQQQIAILAGEVAAANTIVELAMNAFATGSCEKEIKAAKIRVGEAVSVGVPIAHQVHGAIGFTDEHTLQHSTRRLWSWRDEYGAESYWADRLGLEVLQQGADHFWSNITIITGKVSSTEKG
jgi:acyl-CoA dehydrogenase